MSKDFLENWLSEKNKPQKELTEEQKNKIADIKKGGFNSEVQS